jgi:hypothetical protein
METVGDQTPNPVPAGSGFAGTRLLMLGELESTNPATAANPQVAVTDRNGLAPGWIGDVG